jgi:hypothetical protein
VSRIYPVRRSVREVERSSGLPGKVISNQKTGRYLCLTQNSPAG